MNTPKKRVSVKDLIRLPHKQETVKARVARNKVTNWHLTSDEMLNFIEEADIRKKEQLKKKENKENIAKMAIKEHFKKERIEKKLGNKN